MDLSPLGFLSIRFRTGGIIDGEDAVGSSAGSGLILKNVKTNVVKLVDIPAGFREEVLELLVIDVGFSGDGG